MIAPEALVGVWHLERCVVRYSDGRPEVEPFGPDARGILMYDASGWMSAVLCRGERPDFGEASLETAQRASLEDKAAAFESYLSYAGRWYLEGDTVVHEVVHALTPTAEGRAQRRDVRLDDQGLHLSYALTPPSGVTRTFRLSWRTSP